MHFFKVFTVDKIKSKMTQEKENYHKKQRITLPPKNRIFITEETLFIANT